jgi:hypothetical protein
MLFDEGLRPFRWFDSVCALRVRFSLSIGYLQWVFAFLSSNSVIIGKMTPPAAGINGTTLPSPAQRTINRRRVKKQFPAFMLAILQSFALVFAHGLH